MSPPPNQSEPQRFSRRSFLTAAGTLAAATAVGVDLLSNPSQAHAAITWGHPFTFYSRRSRGFTGQWPNGHAGTDYTPGESTPIHAVADGFITLSGVSGTDGAYGESIWIDHGEGYRSIYAHMEVGSRVGRGSIRRGQYIGKVGNTGKSSGPHLHIEIQRNGIALNPDQFINPPAPLADGNSGSGPATPDPTILYRRNNNMSSLYYTTVSGVTTFALAGDGIGSAAWLETQDQGLANQLALQHGNAAFLTPSSFNAWKARYLGQA